MVAAQAADGPRCDGLRMVGEISARHAALRGRFVAFAATALVCCATSWLGVLHGPAVIAFSIAAIAIAMWHGAYDQVQGEQVLGRNRTFGNHWLAVFLVGYVVLAGATLVGWWLFPLASLAMFLLYSSWHFGTEPEEGSIPTHRAAAAVALGAVPIVASARWHAAAVQPIIAAMLHGAGGASLLTHILSVLCWPVAAIALTAIALGFFGHSLTGRAELAFVTLLQLALFFCCDPVVAFAVFFCCWHTPEHLVATSLPSHAGETLRGNIAHNLRVGLVPWLLSLVLLVAALFWGAHGAVAYEAEIFIVLSALTVPHMALNEIRRLQHA